MHLYVVSFVDTSMPGLIFQSEMEKFPSGYQKNSFVAQWMFKIILKEKSNLIWWNFV